MIVEGISEDVLEDEVVHPAGSCARHGENSVVWPVMPDVPDLLVVWVGCAA